MCFPNIFVKRVMSVLGEVEVMLVLDKVKTVPVLGEVEVILLPNKILLSKDILDSILLACLLIDNY